MERRVFPEGKDSKKRKYDDLRWSRFRNLLVEFDSGRPPSVTEEQWRDSWFFSAGAEYRWNEKLTLRGGVAYDQTPVRAAERTPRLPDNDRTWLSVGASSQVVSNAVLTASYCHIFVADSTVSLGDPGPGNFNLLRGNLDANYHSAFDLFAVQLRLVF